MAKKFYKKCDIIFWFVFMSLPILVYIIRIIGLSFGGINLKEVTDITTYVDYINSNNSMIMGLTIRDFSSLNMPFLTDLFEDLSLNIGINSVNATLIGMLFGYFASVVFYHLLLDIVVFIPKFFHNFLRRVNKYDE